uniref:PRA1 family protein n=1 Tax=Trichuris muris TaxID=70415 RepID=A0A5S6QWK8_TRIMR
MVVSCCDLQLPPLRGLDDFLLGSARFQLPPFGELGRWCNRISNNLLYYQTNYLLLCLVCFLLIGCNRPNELLIGTTVLVLTVGCTAYASSRNPKVIAFKQTYPVLSLVAIVSILYLLVRLVHSVTFSLFALAVPMLICFIHASCRLRNLKNKLSNKAEDLKVKKTPVGTLFELCVF